MDYADKNRRLQEYIESLEEERGKIQVFQRELPLCLQLVTQAIESCRQQMTTELLFPGPGRSDSSSESHPVLEEFIPLKRSSSSSQDDDRRTTAKDKKPDWLRSVQLWNQDLQSDPPTEKQDPIRKPSVVEANKGAFHPFCKEDGRKPATASVSSTAETGSRDEKEGQSGHRKARRCWSPELHRRFLHALQQLGGSHAATPKQIRELMKVDGLTNDEVKSHLQKYRLHTRRPSPTIPTSSSPQHPQFVVVGGIWVSPPEYAAAATAEKTQQVEATSGATNEIYAPVAILPSQPQQNRQSTKQSQTSPVDRAHSEGRISREEHTIGEEGTDLNSPATSTSSHATTSSPSY